MAAVQLVVDRAQLRVRAARGALRGPAIARAAVGHRRMQPGARGGEHRRAAGGRLDVVRPAHRQAGDVRAQLAQQPPLRPAADAHDLARRMAGAGDRLDHVAQRQRVALEQRAGEVGAAVRGRQPEPARACVRRSTPAPSRPRAPAPTTTPPAPGGAHSASAFSSS